VIGRTARYVAAPKALEHVFGYTVMLDISDRGGRPPGGVTGTGAIGSGVVITGCSGPARPQRR
jgi:2-keto-4-pentenoate hydratase/2-oxohepta-3-ene-1,7-dioic acid hydratase in catechol pathway